MRGHAPLALSLLSFAVSGCNTILHKPTAAPSEMTLQKARAVFDDCARNDSASAVSRVRFRDDRFWFEFKSGSSGEAFVHTPDWAPWVEKQNGGPLTKVNEFHLGYKLFVDVPGRKPIYMFSFLHGHQWGELARRCADALYVISRGVPAESAEEAARFEAEARGYRDAAVKPTLPEEALRFKAQAEAAVREKRFADAAELYAQALAAAPWWPGGRFNLALLLGDLEERTAAAREMKRYLLLAPDAPNARAAQDKIYEWEAKATP